jgi:hypothetical protein
MPTSPNTTERLVDSLIRTLELVRHPTDQRTRNEAVAGALRHLGDLLETPPADPEYHSTEDHRGTPFGPGAPIPYRKGSVLYRALAIFRDHSLPITRTRFVECGGNPRDLDRLIEAGHVVRFGN